MDHGSMRQAGRSFVIGIDFGTETARALIVDARNGEEIGEGAVSYLHGVIVDRADPSIARHNPLDYISACVDAVRLALKSGTGRPESIATRVIGIGLDSTSSTPMPVAPDGRPVAADDPFTDRIEAMAWLWKDHSAYDEAAEISDLAARIRPRYLEFVGGSYSEEWYWAKLFRCARIAPDVMAASATWTEVPDWLAATLCGHRGASAIRRGTCAAGHKALYRADWGGYPDGEFLAQLHPELARIGDALPKTVYPVGDAAGELSEHFAREMGVPAAIPVAISGIDAHMGALGAGIRENMMVKIMGTSIVDMVVQKSDNAGAPIPGTWGTVPESIRPGHVSIESGQSAVGDAFNWFANSIAAHPADEDAHEALTRKAERLQAGETGLLALDWLNGNRSVLGDPRLSGLIVGTTLHTKPEEIYRTLIEASAFGARKILERLEEHGVVVDSIIACGGIPSKSPFVMQVFANVLNKTIYIAQSEQTPALGSAMVAAVAAGERRGGQRSIETAIEQMTRVREVSYAPDSDQLSAYRALYRLFSDLHDTFGTTSQSSNLYHVMKELASLRDRVRGVDRRETRA